MTLGFITAIAGMGFHAPAVMIVSFIPMLLIAAAYNYMNKADPDCGTSFTWVTRALGPRLGWLTGWTIVAADVVVMATLAYIAAVYTFLLFGLDAASTNLLDISIVAAIWIVVMTWICYIGIEISARTQFFLLRHRDLHAGPVRGGGAVEGLRHRRCPTQSTSGSAGSPRSGCPAAPPPWSTGCCSGVFIYWGWDSGVCVNEESTDSANGPGKAAVMSTILLVLIYVVVADSGPGVPRPALPKQQLRRRARRPGRQRPRLPARQTADHHGADLGLGVDPDDDPADGPDDALDGALRLDPEERSGGSTPAT